MHISNAGTNHHYNLGIQNVKIHTIKIKKVFQNRGINRVKIYCTNANRSSVVLIFRFISTMPELIEARKTNAREMQL